MTRTYEFGSIFVLRVEPNNSYLSKKGSAPIKIDDEDSKELIKYLDMSIVFYSKVSKEDHIYLCERTDKTYNLANKIWNKGERE